MIIILKIYADVARWYKDGILHREDAPAIITENTFLYFVEGRRKKWQPR